MRLSKRVVAAVFVATAALTALAPQAVAVPMPWQTSNAPTTITHHPALPEFNDGGTFTVRCGNPCYQ